MKNRKLMKSIISGLKGVALAAIVVGVVAVPGQARQRRGQGQLDPERKMGLIWPQAMEEFAFPTLPAGGWNTLGTFGARSAAMGETFLSGQSPAAGILNPGFLTRLSGPELSLSYRYTAHSYETLPGFALSNLTVLQESTPSSFKRQIGYPDGVGLAFPLGAWSFSAGYFVFQEYNIPDASASFFSMPNKVKQSGEMRGINLALANSITDAFSVGISASYLYGRISRFEVSPIYTILGELPAGSLLADLRKLVLNLLFQGPVRAEDMDMDLSGFFVNLGATYRWRNNMLVGFSLRAPFILGLEVGATRSFPGSRWPEERFSAKAKLDQPLVATASLLYLPTPSFTLAADLSYWAWKGCRSKDNFRWMYPAGFENILKLNLGAEYAVPLPSRIIRSLALRAGYIHDPQPYPISEGFSRDFATAGFGLKIGPCIFDAAAKIQLFDLDPGRFHTNIFSVGLSYEF